MAATSLNPHPHSLPESNGNVHVCAEVTEETPLIRVCDKHQEGGVVLKYGGENETLGYIMLLVAAVFFCLMSLFT